jgi:hypothetical protein
VRKRYVQIDGALIEVTGDYIAEPRAPMVMPDIAPYQSMKTGEIINSRSRHREHLRAHQLIEVGNEVKNLAKPQPLPPVKKDLIEALHKVREQRRHG